MKNLGLNMQIKLNDGQEGVVNRLADSVNTERLSNNPVSLTRENIIYILILLVN